MNCNKESTHRERTYKESTIQRDIKEENTCEENTCEKNTKQVNWGSNDTIHIIPSQCPCRRSTFCFTQCDVCAAEQRPIFMTVKEDKAMCSDCYLQYIVQHPM